MVDDRWEIIDRIPDDDKALLTNEETEDFERTIEKLKNNPFEFKISKKMRKPIDHLRQSYVGKKSCRLLFKVELSTHRIYLVYLGSRTYAINM